jgi:hypothetical protein
MPDRAASETVAGAGVWAQHLAVIRAYYADAWLAGRSVLAPGCETGRGELASLGARVIAVRDDFNPDGQWPFGQIDLVLHLGLLPQLDASHASLRHACAHARHLVVESAVCDSDDPDLLVSGPPDPTRPDPRVPSRVIYPSPARIERILREQGMLFQRLADSRCNGRDHVYDWLAAGTGRATPGQRRLWFARRG